MSEGKKIVIIGGVAGGASTAARLRRLDESAHIVMLERSGYVSYANCGLPYFIGGIIKERKRLTLQTPESFHTRFNVDARVNTEATSIDRTAKTIHARNLETGEEYDEPYDVLVLSPGARPLTPPLPGIDGPNIFTLRNVEDTYAIADFIDQKQPKSAAVVGAGFIGLEMAENLADRGIAVTVIDKLDHVMPTLDADMAALVHNQLYDAGIKLRLRAGVAGFAPQGDAVEVSLDDDCGPIVADMAILAIGVRPESSLAEAAGLPLGVRGTIKVDDHLRTEDSSIYAVGDAIEVTNPITGEATAIPLAGPANKQGRIVADNICGADRAYKGTIGTSIMKCFDSTIASCGLTSHAAQTAGIDFDYVVTVPNSHATYYPGAKSTIFKVLYERGTNRIIGAQIFGSEGVDKHIDVLACAIGQGATADDLMELELSYAPPYSSAKDPVNMVGFVIENITTGLTETAHWDVLKDFPEDAVLLDVRTPREFAQDHEEGAVHIPLDELRDRLDELDPKRFLYVYCEVGIRSYNACRILAQHGFDCAFLEGGHAYFSGVDYASWRKEATTPCGMPQ